MKRFFPIVTILVLSVSCTPFVAKEYGFWFRNDTDEDLFFVMDFKPEDQVMNYDSYNTFVFKHSCHPMSRPIRDGWENYIRDSVHIYLGHLDSVYVNGDDSKFTIFYLQQEIT